MARAAQNTTELERPIDPAPPADPTLTPPPPPAPPLVPPVAPVPPPAWNLDMEAAWRDGRLVLLTADPEAAEGIKAVWYTNRGSARPWQKPRTGWMGVTPREWVAFRPVAWAPPNGT